MNSSSSRAHVLLRSDFSCLMEILQSEGYRIVGPVISEGSIQWQEVHSPDDLPVGWKDQQQPGNYRLEQERSSQYFGVVHGPQSLKPLTFAPRETLCVLNRQDHTFSTTELQPEVPLTAVLGARACDLAGLGIQDQIFLQGPYVDPYYQRRRDSLFLIAVNCTRALETCFCASMGTGPKAKVGYDLRLTEGDEDFIIEAGSPAGENVLRQLPSLVASEDRIRKDEERMAACASSQTRSLPVETVPQVLYEAHEHPRWDQVATRCLSCTNCTMVCPTCFCHGVEEKPTLDLTRSEHARVWDSCFTPDHGYIHGKNFRPTTKDRYRMWLTHKLGTWVDQYGTSGCVGCGRCITWCPVGIDLTEEVQALIQKEPSTNYIRPDNTL